MEDLYNYIDPKTGENAALLSKEVYDIIMENKNLLDSSIIYDRDFRYDYFGFKTLTRSYLMKLNGEIAERPQQMLMRVSVRIQKMILSQQSKPTTSCQRDGLHMLHPHYSIPELQNHRCLLAFLLTTKEDSINGIYDTLKSCAQISQSAGGIGLSIHDIRATGSYIKGTNGTSNGIVPMLRVFNDTARYVDQGEESEKVHLLFI